jgi:3-hydroxyisobutyrate dehydrogenase-like beta-hydroxyacid dehydrogenase
MRVGLVGLGRMGAAIAARLVSLGVPVTVWDRDPGRLAIRGTVPAGCARDVAEASDTVLSIITEDSGVRALWNEPDGFLSAGIAGKLFVEMSTLQPMTVRDLAAVAVQRGAGFVDSPVLGSIPTVKAGQLVSLIGGSDEDVGRAREVLGHLTAKVRHLGPVGAGCAMKLAVNNLMGCYLQVLGESLAMGEGQGLDIDQMLEVIGESVVATPWFQGKRAMLQGAEGETTLDVRTLRKDLMSMVATAALVGVPTPAAAAAAQGMSAAVEGGFGGKDIAVLPGFFRRAMVQKW